MTTFIEVAKQLFWSSCPSRSILERIEKTGIVAVINLTYECMDYNLSPMVKLLHYPIDDFSFIPPEDALLHLLCKIAERLNKGLMVL